MWNLKEIGAVLAVTTVVIGLITLIFAKIH